MPRWIISLAALSLAGCAGISYLADNYPGAAATTTATASTGNRFMLFVHRANPAIASMDDPATGTANAVAAGLTFGIAPPTSPQNQHEDAVIATFARLPELQCRHLRSVQVERITFEHRYECQGGRVLTREDIARAWGGPTR